MVEVAAVIATIAFIAPMCFSPGPNNLLCAAHGSQHGWKRTIPLTLGMVVGWSTLGLIIGFGTSFMSEDSIVFKLLTWAGAIYITYLAYKIATTTPRSGDSDGAVKDGEAIASDLDQNVSTPLGFKTGLVLQFLNGKAWIHFLVLMTSFSTTFGSSLAAMVMLVGLNAMFGYPAVLTWTAAGVTLNQLFSTPEKAKFLNAFLGLLLFSVAIWIVLPH